VRAWRDGAVVSVALVTLFAGFGQFGAVAALGQVSLAFGHHTGGATVAEEAGLSGTALGIGLAILRLSSLGGLPLTAVADRIGRRRVLLGTCAVGLAFTAGAALSPSYWWFVAIFALGRPFLSATSGVAQVSAAEETASSDRAKAIALIAAGYAVGAGTIAIVDQLGKHLLSFRAVFALALVPLLLLTVVGRKVREPDRFAIAERSGERAVPVLGPIERRFRGRLVVVCTLFFALSVVTGPATSFLFLYAENIERASGVAVSLMVVAAGAAGLGGLLFGRWSADRFGRRPTAGLAMMAMCACGVVSYLGGQPALYVGYVAGVLVAAAFAPAAGAIVNELFPTEVRASVIGWEIAAGVVGATVGLVVFGVLVTATGGFRIAALGTFLPILPVPALLWLVPETRGVEPEDLEPRSRTPRRRQGATARRTRTGR